MTDEYTQEQQQYEDRQAEEFMSGSINELATALAKAQSQITGAVKDSANPFFKSRYADLASVMDACRKPLSDNGLSYVQLPGNKGAQVTLTTLLLHTSGQWVRSTIGTTPAKTDAQALGSVTTYLRRYGLSAIAGIAQVDDDGNASSGKKEVKKVTPDKSALKALKAAESLDALGLAWQSLTKEQRVSIGSEGLDAIKASLS